MWRQLIQPNYDASALPYFCLSYAESFLNAPHIEACATDAWDNTQFKHEGEQPPEAIVPVWFSWNGTVGGVYKNWGHVAVYVPGQGYYSSPYNVAGHKVSGSLDEIINAIGGGATYLGWSEDISTLRIVKGEEMLVTQDNLKYLYMGIYGQSPDVPVDPNDPEIGKDYADTTERLLDYANRNGFAYWQYKPAAENHITDLEKQLGDALKPSPTPLPAPPETPPTPDTPPTPPAGQGTPNFFEQFITWLVNLIKAVFGKKG